MSLNDNRDNSLDLLLTVTWKDDFVVLIDQTKLPNKLAYVRCKNYKEVANARN
jgi:methylthioribose-1-phosphate isomerase